MVGLGSWRRLARNLLQLCQVFMFNVEVIIAINRRELLDQRFLFISELGNSKLACIEIIKIDPERNDVGEIIGGWTPELAWVLIVGRLLGAVRHWDHSQGSGLSLL